MHSIAAYTCLLGTTIKKVWCIWNISNNFIFSCRFVTQALPYKIIYISIALTHITHSHTHHHKMQLSIIFFLILLRVDTWQHRASVNMNHPLVCGLSAHSTLLQDEPKAHRGKPYSGDTCCCHLLSALMAQQLWMTYAAWLWHHCEKYIKIMTLMMMSQCWSRPWIYSSKAAMWSGIFYLYENCVIVICLE